MFNALIRRFSVSARIAAAALTFCLFLLLLFPLVNANYQMSTTQIQAIAHQELPAATLLLEASNLIASSEMLATQSLADALTTSAALADLDLAIARLSEAEALIAVDTSSDAPSPLVDLLVSVSSMRDAITTLDASLAAGDQTGASLAAQIQVTEAQIAGDRARAQILALVTERHDNLDIEVTNILDRWNDQYTALIALIVGMVPLAVLIALVIGGTITRPLADINAAVISFFEGNLDAVAPSHGQNEMSALGRTINNLFTNLSHSNQLMRLEMEERTTALANRTVRLQTAAEITRDAAAISDLDELLNRVANLVRERFDYYYVGIFLLDVEGKFALMRAGSGEAGRILKSRGFRLRVGDPNLIGLSTQTGEVRIVNDVTSDFTHHREPLLPLTRSEAVLPLKVSNNRVIGTLDVQCATENGFDSETLSVLQIMADQLGMVIENSRLTAALDQAQQESATLMQRYTQETWGGLAQAQAAAGYRFDLIEVNAFDETTADPKLAAALVDSHGSEGRAVVVPLENGGSLLRAPLMMYNEVVGVIGLEEVDPTRTWSEDEVKILEALTAQISLALENARLLEEAQRRTTQLRLLQEVTAAASAHTAVEDLLDNVAQTLREGLDLDFVGATIFSYRIPGFSATRERFGTPKDQDPRYDHLQTIIWDVRAIPAVRALVESGRSELLQVEGGARQLSSAAYLLEQVGIVSVLLQPILYRGQVIGLLDLHTSLPQNIFGAENRNLMDQVTLQLSSAVEVALTFAQTTRRAERERRMTAVIQRIRETLDIPTILRTAAEEIRGSLLVGSDERVESGRQTEVVVRLSSQGQPVPTSMVSENEDKVK